MLVLPPAGKDASPGLNAVIEVGEEEDEEVQDTISVGARDYVNIKEFIPLYSDGDGEGGQDRNDDDADNGAGNGALSISSLSIAACASSRVPGEVRY